MKRLISSILCVFLISLSLMMTYASADGYNLGIVVSSSCSIRESPDTRSNRLYSIKNQDQIIVIGEYYDWYYVDCYQSGLSPVEQYGYVLKSYITLSGYYITINDTVKLYCDPWGTPLTNGQKARSGESMFVLSENEDWLCCQLKTVDKQPGSCFIKKSDIGWYDGQPQPIDPYTPGSITPPGSSGSTWRVMYDSDGVSVGIREQPDLNTKKLAIIHSGDIVTVLDNQGEFAYVLYVKSNGQEVRGWVRTKYFVPAN